MKRLLCMLGLRRHRPVREMTAAGTIYRCANCGTASAGVMEMLDPDEDGYVPVERAEQVPRLHPVVRVW